MLNGVYPEHEIEMLRLRSAWQKAKVSAWLFVISSLCSERRQSKAKDLI